jgi:hypothetical protein
MWGGGEAFMENASPGVHRRFTALEQEVATLKQKLLQKVGRPQLSHHAQISMSAFR